MNRYEQDSVQVDDQQPLQLSTLGVQSIKYEESDKNTQELRHGKQTVSGSKCLICSQTCADLFLLIAVIFSFIISLTLICLTLTITHTHENDNNNINRITCFRLCNNVTHFCDAAVVNLTSSEAPCCENAELNTQDLLNVLLIARLSKSEDQRKILLKSAGLSTSPKNQFHQAAFLDTRYVHHMEEKERFPWLVSRSNCSETSGISYCSQKRSFTIHRNDLYHIYVSLTFTYNYTTGISSVVYRKRMNSDEELPLMNRTINMSVNKNTWVYYDMQMSGMFHLSKGDELHVRSGNADGILQYVVCNYFGIFSVPVP